MSTDKLFEKPKDPYPLSEGDIVPGWRSTSFSRECAEEIRNTLKNMGMTLSDIAISNSMLTEDVVGKALNKRDTKSLLNPTFMILLRSLERKGVIKLPEGQTPETLLEMSIEPYILSKKDIAFKKQNVSLLGADPKEIQRFITQNGLNQKIISERCGLKHTEIVQFFSERSSFFSKTKFQECLTALIENNFIKLEKGQTLKTLLEKPTEPSTPSKESIRSGERQSLKTYPLSDRDIVFNGDQVSFSKAAGQKIQSRITQNQGLTEEIIGQSCNLSEASISCTLAGNKRSKQTFANILMALMEHGVIQLPKGQHLGQLLYPKSESSYTPTSKTLNTAKSCTDVAGGGDSNTHSSLLTIRHSAHIDHNNGR